MANPTQAVLFVQSISAPYHSEDNNLDVVDIELGVDTNNPDQMKAAEAINTTLFGTAAPTAYIGLTIVATAAADFKMGAICPLALAPGHRPAEAWKSLVEA